MSLSKKTINNFINATNDSKHFLNKEQHVRGTVEKIENGQTYVIIDGTTESTPVSKSMDAIVGDRVILLLRNNTATIVGNITSPASARTASSYMDLAENGLIIGRLNNQRNPVGPYSRLLDGYYICSIENGQEEILARFQKNNIKIGNVNIGVNDYDQLFLYNSDGSIGLRADNGNQNDSLETDLLLTVNGIAARLPNGTTFTINGYPVLTNEMFSSLITFGSCTLTGTIPAKKYGKIRTAVNVPSGYKLCGISKIDTNHEQLFSITSFEVDPNNDIIAISINSQSTIDRNATIIVKWFAIKSSNYITNNSESFNLVIPNDDND